MNGWPLPDTDELATIMRLLPWIAAVLVLGGLLVGYCIGKLL